MKPRSCTFVFVFFASIWIITGSTGGVGTGSDDTTTSRPKPTSAGKKTNTSNSGTSKMNCTTKHESVTSGLPLCNFTSNATTPASNATTPASNVTTPASGPFGGALLPKIDINDNNFGMYLRAFYVIIGITAIVVVYLGVKTYMTRRKKRKARKYGMLTDRHLELNTNDDEEEDELFDQSRRRLIN